MINQRIHSITCIVYIQLVGLFFFSYRINAQGFEYIDNHLQSTEILTMTTMGYHYYLGGFIEPESWLSSAPYVVKLGTTGDTVWTHIMESSGNERDQVVDMVATSDKNLGVLSQIDKSLVVSEMDVEGSIIWSYTSETIEHPVALTSTSKGELIACGSCESENFNDGENTICIVKLDSDGEPLWTTLIGEGDRIKPYALKLNPSGELIVIAKQKTDQGNELFLTRIHKKGKVLNTITLDYCDIGEAFALEIDKAGNMIIAGEAESESRPVLVKLDPKGELIWQQIYGGESGNYRAYAVSITSDKGYVLVGRTNDAKAFMIKTDDLGNQEWVKHFSGIEKAGFKKVLSTSDDFVAAGVTLSRNTNKAYCIKTQLNP